MISSVKGNIKNAYAMAYHAVYYANGTKCDVTGYPRTAIAKVRYYLSNVEDGIMDYS